MAARSRSGRAQPSEAPLAEYRRKRDFQRTPEPSGSGAAAASEQLAFVVQKHAARQLHFDLRLELGGVMKSWAVPKGPSLDPKVKRLAVEVEDHPLEYNSFEGTIPAGEYGGGTVMLWDRGHYTVDELKPGEDPEKSMRRGLREGKLSITFHGDRLHGSYALVRTRSGDAAKPQWLFFKHSDAYADPDRDIVAEIETSVDSGRTMDEIAAGVGGKRVWSSRAGEVPVEPDAAAADRLPELGFEPMLATSSTEVPRRDGWVYEPKMDGIRVVAFVTGEAVALRTRNGNDKRRQFPEVAAALQALARAAKTSFVADGEIVALRDGEIVRFESLQSRMHLTDRLAIERLSRDSPAAIVLFDLLLLDQDVLLGEPWAERRARLERLLERRADQTLRLSECSDDPDAMLEQARAGGWEGLIAKRTDAPYQPGKRSRSWLKLKLENRQELVVGGWTEPRNSREHIGALLLGYHDPEGRLVYAGHTGSGLSQADLRDLHGRLTRLERKTSPFTTVPKTNQPAHWVTPKLVVEVRFNEWTSQGLLRQPVFLGLRDDKDPAEVVREPPHTAAAPAPARAAKRTAERSAPTRQVPPNPVVAQLEAIESSGGDGRLKLPRGRKLEVTNLGKLFFPPTQQTKGDLLRYYAAMAEHILPQMKDRPLVLKRFPDGVRGKSFYQQSPPDAVPDGVRVEVLTDDGEEQRRFVGGELITLLYTIQLGAISYDPWHSRVGRLEYADYTVIDLDPGPEASFETVVEVARRTKQELDRAGLNAALKTSGSRGLHIYVPLPPRTPLEAATLVAQIIALRVASRYPKIATIERMTRNRQGGAVYVDYLQNILGKTIAGVYAARATPEATVSTPLRWEELESDLRITDFTITTVPDRVARIGDLWGPAMRARNSLEALMPR